MHEWPDEALMALAPDVRTAVVTLTHDPKLDDPALIAALRSPAFYIGSLGSRRTHRARLERLRKQGCEESAMTRIHAPVGLDIGAESPAEIATSVLAEITRRSQIGAGVKFGPLALDEAEGALLAHSLRVRGVALRKGHSIGLR